MSRTDATIETPDGACRAFVFRPDEGAGPWPAVIYYMDAPAIRPVLFEMCQEIADHDYLVLLPDLFYRAGPYEPINLREIFGEPARREHFWKTYVSTTSVTKAAEDTQSFLGYLDTLKDVRGERIGVTGYCMGGGMALTVAGRFPERVAAAASFHGGRLATDSENSPHRLAPHIQARVLVAGAEKDQGFPPEQRDRLAAALDAAGVDHRTEIWEGAQHGWTMRDQPVYDEAAARRHLRELVSLLDATLKV
jgi:carboxymethylenebutenolidase